MPVTVGFVLGAGFSRAVSEEMPVVADLVGPLADHLDDHVAPRYGATLRRLGDLEVVLTSWHEPQPWLLEEKQLENAGAFRRSARWLAGELFARQQHVLGGGPVPDWLGALVRRWHRDRASVVTLNYDTLVESAAKSAFLPESLRATVPVHQSLYMEFMPILDARAGFAVLAGDIAETFSLLKLHGSLNWWYDPYGGATSRPYDADCVDPWDRSEPTGLESVRQRARGLEPLIVPPTTAKSSSLGNTWLRGMWLDAHRHLEACDVGFLLGYSMPPADISIRLLLGTASKLKTLVPVNTDDRVVARLRDLFPAVRVVDHWVGEDDPVQVFARTYAEDPDTLVNDLT